MLYFPQFTYFLLLFLLLLLLSFLKLTTFPREECTENTQKMIHFLMQQKKMGPMREANIKVPCPLPQLLAGVYKALNEEKPLGEGKEGVPAPVALHVVLSSFTVRKNNMGRT